MVELIRLGLLIGRGGAVISAGAGDDMESGQAIFASGQWGYWTPGNSATSLVVVGMLSSAVHSDNTSSSIDDNNGHSLRQSTAASVDSEAVSRGPNDDKIQVQYQPLVVARTRISSVSDIRYFVGLANFTTVLAGDDPALTAVGVQYSSVRDTNFQFMIDDGTTQSLSDSGIAADTSVHYTKVEVNAADIKISLLDSSFAEEASNTFTTSLPGATASYRMFSGVRTLAAVVKSIDQYHATVVNRAL